MKHVYVTKLQPSRIQTNHKSLHQLKTFSPTSDVRYYQNVNSPSAFYATFALKDPNSQSKPNLFTLRHFHNSQSIAPNSASNILARKNRLSQHKTLPIITHPKPKEKTDSVLFQEEQNAMAIMKKATESVAQRKKPPARSLATLNSLLMPKNINQVKNDVNNWRMNYYMNSDTIESNQEKFLKKHGKKFQLTISGQSSIQSHDEHMKSSNLQGTTRDTAYYLLDRARSSFSNKGSILQNLLADTREEAEKRKKRFKQAVKKLVLVLRLVNQVIAAFGGNPKKVLKYGLIAKAFPARPFQNEGASQFFKAVNQNDMLNIKLLLAKNRFLVYEFDFVGRTALHIAAWKNHELIMEELLKRLADPNATDYAGRTPIFIAAKYGTISTVKLLLRYRANPLFQTKAGLLPIDVAHTYMIQSILHTARQVQHKIDAVISKDKRESAWKFSVTMHFMPAKRDLEDTELDEDNMNKKKFIENDYGY